MKITLQPNADTNFTSLAGRMNTSPEEMERKFGPAHRESCEQDKGYDHGEWFFEDDEGAVFTVYFRYDECSIGAHPRNHHKAAAFREAIYGTPYLPRRLPA